MTGNKLNKDASHGVDLMQKALLTKHEKVMRASFFNNCGYALVWADRHKEANGLFKIAAENDPDVWEPATGLTQTFLT